jgi:hypothetical protein
MTASDEAWASAGAPEPAADPGAVDAGDGRGADAGEGAGPRYGAGERADADEGAGPRDGRLALALEAAAVFFVALAVFTWKLLPDVGYWDTAIFQAAPPVLGLTHPTGFPTWNLLGWLWTTILPLGAPALELNLLTAVAAALAIAMTYVVARQIRSDRLPAAAAALTCGLMVSFWRTAGHADPHPLHVLLAMTVLSLLLAWGHGRRPRYLVAAALLFALGMGNHMLMAVLAPGIGIYVLAARPSVLREPRTIVASVAALLAGLAVYAYVPIRGGANPAIHYDYAPTTPELFLRYVLGQDFSGQMAFLSIAGLGQAAAQVPTFAKQLGDTLTPPIAMGIVVLAAVGLGALVSARAYRTAWLLAATGGLTLYARLTYQNGDLERYQLFPVAVMAALAALGATAAWHRIRTGGEVAGEPVSAGQRNTGALGPLAGTLPGVLLLVPIALFAVNGDKVKVADSRCFVGAVVAEAPHGAAIVSWWSMATPIWYAQAVEGHRPDLTVVSAGSTVVAEIERFRAEGRPVLIIQPEGEVRRAQEAGFPMEELRLCGTGALLVTGPAGTVPPPEPSPSSAP